MTIKKSEPKYNWYIQEAEVISHLDTTREKLVRIYLQEYDSWLLNALKENFPDDSLSALVRDVKVEKWPNHTVLTRHGVSFTVWKEPTFKWEVLCQ